MAATTVATKNYSTDDFASVQDPLSTAIPMTLVYTAILITGIIGNLCTCIVIARNKYMHTATNYYLFSLAVSDLLLLILGLPQEILQLWKKFPYVFGETFCVLRGWTSESCTNSSILTITAFTIERYVAICHPLRAHTMSQLPRAIKSILLIWIIASVAAIPAAWPLGILYQTKDPESSYCSIKRPSFIPHVFELSGLFFFILPISLIIVLYVLIGIQLRRSSSIHGCSTTKPDSNSYSPPSDVHHSNSSHPHQSLWKHYKGSSQQSASTSSGGKHQNQRGISLSNSSSQQCRQNASRRSVIKMLVAVVVSFIICWTPFHAQRIIASFSLTNNTRYTQYMIMIYHLVFYISGISYYLTATINPILYHLMSRKFRVAFKDTFGFWAPCCKVNRSPEFVAYSMANDGNTGGNTVGNNTAATNSLKLQRFGSYYRNGSVHKPSASFNQLSELCEPKNCDDPTPSAGTTNKNGKIDQHLGVNYKVMSVSCRDFHDIPKDKNLLSPPPMDYHFNIHGNEDVNEEKIMVITNGDPMKNSSLKGNAENLNCGNGNGTLVML